MRVPSLLLFAALLLYVACRPVSDSGEDPFSLVSSAPVLKDPDGRDSTTHRLEFVRFVGQGVLTDSRGTVAVSRSGLAAVYSLGDCTISAFDLSTGARRFEVGRCGAGPREFRAVSTMAWLGSDLVAFDGASRTLTFLDDTGAFLSRVRFDELVDGQLPGVARLGAVSDSLVVAAVPRGRGTTREEPLLALLNPFTGRVTARFLKDIKAVRDAPDVAPMMVFPCATSRGGVGARIVAFASWRFESIGFDTNGVDAWKSYTDWGPVAEPLLAQGSRVPAALARPPLCGEDAVLLRMSKTPTSAPLGTTLDGGRIEVRDYHGALLIGQELGREAEILFQSGAAGGEYFVFNDSESAEPRLQVFRLVQGAVPTGAAVRPSADASGLVN